MKHLNASFAEHTNGFSLELNEVYTKIGHNLIF